jgi:membrane-associated phospholipid phosphatase
VTRSASPDDRDPSAPSRPAVASERGGSRRPGWPVVAGSLSLVASALLLAVLADAVRRQQTFAFDATGNAFMHALASPALDALMAAATFAGMNVVLLGSTAVIAVALLVARRTREALFLPVVVAGSIVLNTAMKLVFQRPRPDLPWATAPPDFSFPSGHAMNSMAFALAVALVTWRLFGPRWGAVAFVVAVASAGLIGLSRIYLGVHYPSDVLAGFATAALWVAGVAIVAGLVRSNRGEHAG